MSVQLKPPPRPPSEGELEALFREARSLERRRRRRKALASLLLAGAALAVAYGASGSGGGGRGAQPGRGPGAAGGSTHGRVSELNLSAGDRYDTIARVGGQLLLSGFTLSRGGSITCNAAVVSPATLALSQVRSGSCDDPSLAGERVLPLITVERHVIWPAGSGIATETVRIAHVTSSPPGYRVGPVVMTFPQTSDTAAGWAYGDGYLWVYDPTSAAGSELLRISASTGKVLQRLRAPQVYRPIIVADDDGLWLAPAGNSGGAGSAAVYRIVPGAAAALTAFRLPRPGYVVWMVAVGREVWLAASRGGTAGTLWRLRGDGSPIGHLVLARSLGIDAESQHAGQTVVGDSRDGLWTVLAGASGADQRIVRIDQRTGRPRAVATVAPHYGAPSGVPYPYPYRAVTFDRSMYLLDPPTDAGTVDPAKGFSALYRITAPGA